MTPTRLAELYPRLFHMTEAGSWESIRRNGLLSTSVLLDRFEVRGERREALESARRPESVALHHPEHGTATVRDNKPMTDAALRRCLVDMEPEEWYRTLNGRVFFWLSRRRLDRLLSARAYCDREHDVLTLDTAALLDRHADRVKLSPINSGSTIFAPQPRGADTFRRIGEYPFDEWRRRRRGPRNAVVELAVDHAVPDVGDLALRVERVAGGEVVEVIWERPSD